MWWIWDWAKYQNSHSSKSIRVTKLFFCQNGILLGRSFWPKDSFVTLILFELWLLWYLAQSQIHRITLYYNITSTYSSNRILLKICMFSFIFGICTYFLCPIYLLCNTYDYIMKVLLFLQNSKCLSVWYAWLILLVKP